MAVTAPAVTALAVAPAMPIRPPAPAVAREWVELPPAPGAIVATMERPASWPLGPESTTGERAACVCVQSTRFELELLTLPPMPAKTCGEAVAVAFDSPRAPTPTATPSEVALAEGFAVA